MEGTSKNEKKSRNVDGLQLSLGLSMNGTYGVDPVTKKLKRSSSISNLDDSDAVQVAREGHAPVVRASSVPVDNEDETGRGKADQSGKRVEGKKKRSSKKANEDASSENGDQVGLQKCGSSGVYDQQIEVYTGATQNGDGKSPSSIPSEEVQVEEAVLVQANAPGRRNNRLVSTPLLDMPYVCTKGGETRVRGFLYKYEKGEEVKIVCVCHGLFLSPAEFVRHGGGGDVENPLQHIIVNTKPLI